MRIDVGRSLMQVVKEGGAKPDAAQRPVERAATLHDFNA